MHVCPYFQMQKYFLGLKSTSPPMSPVDKSWPARPYRFLDGVHAELRKIFHHWRVRPPHGYLIIVLSNMIHCTPGRRAASS